MKWISFREENRPEALPSTQWISNIISFEITHFIGSYPEAVNRELRECLLRFCYIKRNGNDGMRIFVYFICIPSLRGCVFGTYDKISIWNIEKDALKPIKWIGGLTLSFIEFKNWVMWCCQLFQPCRIRTDFRMACNAFNWGWKGLPISIKSF